MLDGTTFLFNRNGVSSILTSGLEPVKRLITFVGNLFRDETMIQPIDIYNEALRKMTPMDSLRYTIVDVVKNDIKLNFHQMAGSLITSARAIELGILDLVGDCPPDKAIFINQQIDLASTHLSRYIGSDVVNKFITEQTLATGRIGFSHGS